MKNFIQHDTQALTRIDSPQGRVYSTGSVKYPSVTAITGLHSAEGIAKWRREVGEAEANRISSKASRRGTSVHGLCESYLREGAAPVKMADKEVFDAIRPHLDRIDNIHCLEAQLVSHKLRVAGTVDCIAEYDGRPTVIDFKTALRPKIEEYVHGYYMQASAYAFMFYEATGLMVDDLTIIIGVDGGECQIFKSSIVPWLKEFRRYRKMYKDRKGL